MYRLKNYFSILVLGLVANFSYAQIAPRVQPPETIPPNSKVGAFIDVNVPPYVASTYSITQLIKDVLITGGSTCSTPNVSNVVVYPNAAVTDVNRPWGYFNKGTATFPFSEGIVLSTGFAKEAGNQLSVVGNSNNLSTVYNNNSGDQDLATAIGVNNSLLRDPVYVEFDFVPTSTQVKFNYLFASEEYTGSFPCSYSDGFALLLKPVGGAYTNLAVLPAGAGPVSVTNIHPATQYSGAPLVCTGSPSSINPQYFGGYNNPITGHNFNGRTVPLEATANVIPGQTYHFKMVLADYQDNSYDSAVFLEAGSFNIGVQILGPTGVALPATVNMCDNTPQTLSSSIQQAGATYQWTFNGTPISGATSPTYIATQPGIYCLQVSIPGNQCPGEACVTIVGGTSPTVQNTTLTQCYGPGNVTFDLTLAQQNISTTPGVTYTYYTTLANAQAGTNPIANPSSYSSAGNQTIYVVVKSGFCPKIAELQLVKAPQMTATIATPQQITCTMPEVTLNASASIYPPGSTFQWVASAGGYIASGTNTLTPVVVTSGTYTLTIRKVYQPGDIQCTATASVNVTMDKTPPTVTVTSTKTKICEGETVTLTATGGISYIWANNSSTGPSITVMPSTTTTFSVYSVGPNGCKSTNPATITVQVVPAIKSNMPAISGQICTGDTIVLDAAGIGSNLTYLWSTGQTTQTITVGTPGVYTVTIKNGTCEKTFTTTVLAAAVPIINNINFENHTLTLSASNPSNGTLEYSIDNGFTWQDSNVFMNVPNNVNLTLSVRVKKTSCWSSLQYFTFYMSNIITPNGDGVNDIIDFRGISGYKNFDASVFDRYGKQIWKADKANAVWDGKFQSRILPTATYWYQVQFEDPANKQQVQKHGWIMLKNRE